MYKRKRILSMLLAILMLMTSFTMPVSASSDRSDGIAESALTSEVLTETGNAIASEAPTAIRNTIASEHSIATVNTVVSNTETATEPTTANAGTVQADAASTTTTLAGKISQSEPATYGKTIVTVNHENTIEDVLEMAAQYPHSGFNYYKVTAYDEEPVFSNPYSAGSLAQSDIDDAENAIKMVRFLAGVPYEDVTFSDELNNIAQHGAVLLAASNQFSHGPSQPEDMSDEFFALGYQGCSEANIFAGRSNISNAVLGFMYDAGASNIIRAGHRRWILKPGNQEFGIGYADGPNASYGGHRINMHVFEGLGYWECESDSYIAWPSAGAFPIQYFAASEYISDTIDCPWSINLGSPYANPSKESVVVKLTRTRDGKTWIFDKNTPNLGEEGLDDSKLHLSVDNGGYGITKAIIFRPDPDSLGTILDGDTFQVEISGITYTDGSAATLSYEINFFDMNAVINSKNVTFLVTNQNQPLANATITIDGKTLTTDADGLASISLLKDHTYEYEITKEGYTVGSGKVIVGEEDIVQEEELKIVVDFTVNGKTVSYNGSPQEVQLTLSHDVDYLLTYNGSSDLPVDAGQYNVYIEITEEGYTGQCATIFAIKPAELKITADNQFKKIGNEDPALTYTITAGQLYGNDTLTGELTRTAGEAEGIYEIQQGTLQANSNYTLTFQPGTLTISDKPSQNITVSPLPEVTYGDAPFAVEASADSNTNLAEFTYNSSNTDVAEISADGIITIKGVGTTNITVHQAGSDEYAPFTSIQKLVVNPKQVAIRDLNLVEKAARLEGVLSEDTSVTLDFNKLTYEVIQQLDETTAKVHVSNFVLTGEKSENYTVTTQILQTTIKTEDLSWKNPFTDVFESDWYYKSVEYVYKNSLFSGLTATQFGPNVAVTRGMLVTVLYRAEGKPAVTGANQFHDVAAGAYYEKAVTWAQENGIVSGYSDTIFAPDSPILREQIAAIFYRYAKFKGLTVTDTENTALTFKDASDISSYAVKSLQYCIAKNIMYGRTSEEFKPLDHATRAEMAAILQRFLTKIQSGNL